MQHAAELQPGQSGECLAGTLLRPVADADHPFGLQRPDHGAQVRVAGGQQRALLGHRQLVGGEVAAALEEHQRAVVGDEVLGEEGLGRAIAGAEQAPQALAAHLGARAGEAFHRPLRVDHARLPDRTLQPQPVARAGDLAEGHADLRHAEGARVHADEDHAAAAVAIALEVASMHLPGVVERVVDMGDGGREGQCVHRGGQFAGGVDQDAGGHVGKSSLSR